MDVVLFRLVEIGLDGLEEGFFAGLLIPGLQFGLGLFQDL